MLVDLVSSPRLTAASRFVSQSLPTLVSLDFSAFVVLRLCYRSFQRSEDNLLHAREGLEDAEAEAAGLADSPDRHRRARHASSTP